MSIQASTSRIWSRLIQAGPSSLRQASSQAGTSLGDLAPARGSTKDGIRYGRGQGSTKGGTAGRGHKGQKARSGNGKPTPGFEGGQTPLHRLFPKKGFVNFTARTYAPLPLSLVQSSLVSGKLSPSEPITIGKIIRSNLVHGLSGLSGVKLLGPVDPELPLPPLKMQLSRYSKSAAEAVIEAGGEVVAVYKNRLGLRREVWPEKVPEGKDAAPVRKADIRYYSNPKKYGYLAQQQPAEQTPSA